MPGVGDARYANYPFIIAKYWSDNDQLLLRVSIHSESLLDTVVCALDSEGDPDTLPRLLRRRTFRVAP